jgi:hypothetical protein
MSLRALSGEHEAKKLLQSRTKYAQRFFGAYRHFMGLISPPQDKIYPKTVANLGFNQRQRFFGARC